MARLTVVDASVAIAYLDANDRHHTDAVALLAAVDGPLVMHSLTAAEVLVHPMRAGLGEVSWQALLAIGINVHEAVIEPLEMARIRAETGCRMPDCCVLAVAHATDSEILTFDARLGRALDELGPV